MRSSRRAGLFVGGLVIAALLAACSSSSSSDSGGTGTTQAPSSTAAPGTQTVPVTVNTSSSGDFYLTVQVSAGGGQQVPVLLDTGSAGLIMLSSAVGSSTSSTGASFTQEYASGTANTDVMQASVTIGSLSTPSPIAVGVVQDQGGTSGNILPSGVQGILGIDSTLHTTNVSGVDFYSPLLQLGGSLAQGFTLEMPSATSATLTVGPVTAPSGAVALPLSATSPASTYPSGAPVYEKYVQLCWTVGSASSCELTTLDTGSTNPVAAVSGAPHSNDQVTPGTSITVAAPDGGPTLWQFSAASQGSEAVGFSEPSSSNPPANSGSAFFVGRQVAFDYPNGRILVTNP